MATSIAASQPSHSVVQKTAKEVRLQVRLCEKIKTQLNTAVLRGGKVTAEELSDLEKHVQKVASLLN